MENHILN